MSSVIAILVVLAFSICVIVGLLSVLQSMISGDHLYENASERDFHDGMEQF